MATCLRTLSTSKGLNSPSAMVHPQLAASHSRANVGGTHTGAGGGGGGGADDEGDADACACAMPPC
jgi:hypothetical protein